MTLRTPPLRAVHADAGASFTEFGGWEMPVDFGSIQDEHRTVREAAGKFDVSHMGEVVVGGPDAAALCQRLTTNDVTELAPGDAQYTAMTDDEGTLLDDSVLYRRPAGDYLLVPNAGTDAATAERWRAHRDDAALDATVENRTEDVALFAVQGPDAVALVDARADADLSALARFECAAATIAGADCLVSRTGYTGEDGFEVFCAPADAAAVWDACDCPPCGLGARDTLRIEMGFLLAGQDFDAEDDPRTPFEAGIGFVVDLDTAFVGRDALTERTDPDERFTGVRLSERAVPRHGYEIADADGHPVGEVTSGTLSPTLGDPLALGYLPADATPGTAVSVVVRGEPKSGKVEAPPFLDGDE
ncbi:MAG: glycine cleavage system aminomethyltransferase GcvT [Halobacteriaceae archaeon]